MTVPHFESFSAPEGDPFFELGDKVSFIFLLDLVLCFLGRFNIFFFGVWGRYLRVKGLHSFCGVNFVVGKLVPQCSVLGLNAGGAPGRAERDAWSPP